MQQRRRAGEFDGIGDRTERQIEIDFQDRAYLQFNILADLRFEAIRFHLNRIVAGVEGREAPLAGGVRLHRAGRARTGTRHNDGGIGGPATRNAPAGAKTRFAPGKRPWPSNPETSN